MPARPLIQHTGSGPVHHLLFSIRREAIPSFGSPTQAVYRIPVSALRYGHPGVSKSILRIDPLPYGSELWHGRVDIIVAGCTAWSRDRRQLWSLDWDNTAETLDELGPCEREWNDTSWFIPSNVPVACLAGDEQEISEVWPLSAAGHYADAVFTPTQTVILGLRAKAGPVPLLIM